MLINFYSHLGEMETPPFCPAPCTCFNEGISPCNQKPELMGGDYHLSLPFINSESRKNQGRFCLLFGTSRIQECGIRAVPKKMNMERLICTLNGTDTSITQ